MAIALVLVVMATLTLISSACRAQDLELEPCPSPRPVALEHEGSPGFWFERSSTRCLLSRMAALPLYVERVRLLDQRLTLAEARDGLQERRYAAAAEGEQRAVQALEAAERGRREAEEALNAWYRSPVLWVVVGAASTFAIIVASAVALDRLAP
jgi:hypothetical protein